jgi:hypothetical protein
MKAGGFTASRFLFWRIPRGAGFFALGGGFIFAAFIMRAAKKSGGAARI